MEVMGYVIIAENGWLVKRHNDGRTERLSRIERVAFSEPIILD